MQTDKERFNVMSFYYEKAAEIGLLAAADLVQFCTDAEGDWRSGYSCSSTNDEVIFKAAYTWRIKPETVTHKGGEYPKPISNKEDICNSHYVYRPSIEHIRDDVVATFSVVDVADLSIGFEKLGIFHLTKEAAIAHAKVIYQIED